MPLAWMPLLAAMAAGSSSAGGLRPIDRQVVASSAAVALAAPPLVPREGPDTGGPPPCIGDLCQPRVAVPGFEPRVSIRGKRTELTARLLYRAHLEPLASISRFFVVTGLRLDLTPPALDQSTLTGGSGGRGHVQLMLRWRIDPLGKPVWAVVR